MTIAAATQGDDLVVHLLESALEASALGFIGVRV